VKVKFARRQEFVVGGFKPDGGGGFDSLLVGYYEGRALKFAGKVRAGFTPRTRAALFEALAPLAAPKCPFANLPTSKTSHWGEGVTAEEMESLRWVTPKIVIEVTFTEWTRDGNLRHASFAGVRSDKAARGVHRET
jgi:bifunctional non-homologous end joining protein LigD